MTAHRCVHRGLLLAAACMVLGLVAATPAPASAQQKENPLPGFPLPDIENLFPPGTVDPEQLKMLKKLLESNHAEIQKMMEDLKKQFPQGFPGGAPGLPDMKLPGALMPFPGARVENRLGAVLQQPNQTLVEQLELPDKQGLVLKTVKPGSAAAKAGLKANDILLELAGKPVPSNVDGFLQQLNAIKKDTAVDAVVMRKGKKETVKGIKLGEVPANNPFGGGFNPGLPNLQLQPGMFPAAGGLPGAGTNMSIARGPAGAFTTRYKEGDIAVTITGTMENGKANVASIEIREADQTKTYKSVGEVPEEYREDVRVLIRHTEGGKAFSLKKVGR
jgi:membrane-associated protease RseP (regulator of RpoE activity)